MNPHLLTGLLVLPLFGMILLLCLPRTWERALKIVGVGTMLLEFALSEQHFEARRRAGADRQ